MPATAWHALGWPAAGDPQDAFFLSDGNVDELLIEAVENSVTSVCVPSPLVGHAARVLEVLGSKPGAGPQLATVVGWPSGQHPSLVIAAEARLAVASGVSRVYAVPDPRYREDTNALVSFLMTLREAVSAPAELGAYVTGTYHQDPRHLEGLLSAAAAVGVDAILVDAQAGEQAGRQASAGRPTNGSDVPLMWRTATLRLGDPQDPQRPPFEVRTYDLGARALRGLGASPRW